MNPRINPFRLNHPDIKNTEFIALYINCCGPASMKVLHRALLAWRHMPETEHGQLTRYFSSIHLQHGGAGCRGNCFNDKGYWWRPYRGAPYQLTANGEWLVTKCLGRLASRGLVRF